MDKGTTSFRHSLLIYNALHTDCLRTTAETARCSKTTNYGWFGERANCFQSEASHEEKNQPGVRGKRLPPPAIGC